MNRYFSRQEFACQCGCGKDTVDAELLLVLTRLRTHFKRPVLIQSANRCSTHNRAVGGASQSQHLYSKAADIVVSEIDSRQVYDLLDRWYPDGYGLGYYATFTHIDVRDGKARW